MINNINLYSLLFFFILLTLSFFVIGFSFSRKIVLNNIQIPITLALGMSITVIYLTVTIFLSIPKIYALLVYFLFILVNLFHFRKEILNTLYSSKLFIWPNLIYLFFLTILFIFFSSNEPGLWDDTMYHLPYAKEFAQNNFSYPNLSFRYFFPLSGEVLYSFAYILKLDEYGAQLISLFPILISSLILINISDYLKLTNYQKITMIITFIAFEPVLFILGYAYIDYFLLLYCGLGSYIYFISSDISQKKIGLFFIIFGISFKYFALIFLIIFLIFGKIFTIIDIFKKHIFYFISILLTSLLWYFVNFYYVGNPFHPFFSDVFGMYYWNDQDLQNLKNDVAQYNNLYTLHIFFKDYYLLIPFLFSFVFFDSKIKPLWLITLFYLVAWFLFFPVNRYLLVCVLLFFICLLYLCSIINKCFRSKKSVISFIFLLIFLFSSYNLITKIKKSIEINNSNFSKSVYLIPGREAFEFLNKMNAKSVFQFGYENALYYFNGKTFGERVSLFRYSDFLTPLNLIDSVKLTEFLANNKIEFVLVKNKEFDDTSLKNHKYYTNLHETKHYSIYRFEINQF